MMKYRISSIIICFILVTIIVSGSVFSQEIGRETIYQVSTLNALFEGVYDGEATIAQLREYGDIGIGTFNSLDGEMILVDGEFYQIKADGIAYSVSDDQKSPFVVMTFFDNDEQFEVKEKMNFAEFNKLMDEKFTTENIFYMFKVDGEFSYMKTRSVPAQEKPYPVLSEVVEAQPIFEMEDIKGTIVGIRCPQFVEGINLPGYHLHFITEDRKAGGHVLEFTLEKAEVAVDLTHNFYMQLPESGDYLERDLSQDRQDELHKVEN